MSLFEVKADYGIEINVYGRTLLASPSTDSIIRFTQTHYDYLRYVNPEESRITMEFLGQTALGELVGLGIPDGRQRNFILNSEHEEWLAWQERYDMYTLEALIEEAPMPQLTPQELDLFFESREFDAELNGLLGGDDDAA